MQIVVKKDTQEEIVLRNLLRKECALSVERLAIRLVLAQRGPMRRFKSSSRQEEECADIATRKAIRSLTALSVRLIWLLILTWLLLRILSLEEIDVTDVIEDEIITTITTMVMQLITTKTITTTRTIRDKDVS